MSTLLTPTQRAEAMEADLAEFLLANHPDETYYKYGSVLLNANHHISVKHGCNCHGYTNFKNPDEHGNSIDYLINFLDYSYRDAVFALIRFAREHGSSSSYEDIITAKDTDDESGMKISSVTTSAEKTITLPSHAADNRCAIAYLSKTRCIPYPVVNNLIEAGLLYQDDHKNCIFVNASKTYAEIRGTNTYADRRCKHRSECPNFKTGEHGWCDCMEDCSDYKSDPFHGCRRATSSEYWCLKIGDNPDEVYICEAAIDAVSKAVLDDFDGYYISIGGAGNQQAIDRIKNDFADKKIYLCVDNDEAGDACCDRNEDLVALGADHKDWNEDLLALN